MLSKNIVNLFADVIDAWEERPCSLEETLNAYERLYKLLHSCDGADVDGGVCGIFALLVDSWHRSPASRQQTLDACLRQAVCNQHNRLVNLLLDRGGRPLARDGAGHHALWYAYKTNHEVLDALEDALEATLLSSN